MKEPNLMQRIGATPGKLALVAVLAVVLVTVVVGQLPSKKVAPELALRKPTPQRKQSLRQTNPTQQQSISDQSRLKKSLSSIKSKEQSTEKPTWPDLSLETIVAFDPFAPPEWLALARTAEQTGDPSGLLLSESTRRARKAEVLKRLKEQGTTIIVISAEEKRATIGEQTVRIGDHIEGFLISDITKQGVVLSEFE